MKIEVIAFYPSVFKAKSSIMLGSMHVRLPDCDIDIRGIRVFQKKNRLLFFQNRGCYHDEQGKIKHYPIFSFNSVEKNKEFVEALAIAGRQFIERNFSKCILKPPYRI